MKKLSELKVSKDAILSEIDASKKGGAAASTMQYGGGFGTIATYVDGIPWGSDGTSGSLFGDSWRFARIGEPNPDDKSVVKITREG